jgi:exodeoxyribonuclease VII large subunit
MSNLEFDNLSDELNGRISKKKVVDDVINLDEVYDSISGTLSSIQGKTLECEIVSFKYSDVNAYISLKVGTSQVSGIFWRIQYTNKYDEYKKLKDGDKVKVQGNFSVLKKNLSIYFNIKSISKIGTGDYLSLHNELRQKIVAMGWNLNKKVLTCMPYTIAIVTALEGAAIQDILQTLKLDNFIGKVLIKNAIVQGKQCGQSVIAGIKYFEEINKKIKIDVLLITRGGGSYEDLVGFSDWELLEYFNKCNLLKFSAIGHQIDNQLTDEIADYKFATPSIAAKYIVECQQNYFTKYINFKNHVSMLNSKYEETIKYFETVRNNYGNIVNNYTRKEMMQKLQKFSGFINTTLKQYYDAQKIFFDEVHKIKPTILKNGVEVTSLLDFVNPNTKIETKLKNIEIIFTNGIIKLYYKITHYESI